MIQAYSGAVLLEPTDNPEEGMLDFLHEIDGSGGQFLYMPAGGSGNPSTVETVQQRMHPGHSGWPPGLQIRGPQDV